VGLLITLLQRPRKRRQRRIQRRQRIARRPIIRPRQFPAFVGLSLMVGYRTDHHPLVMQSWLRKRRTICRAKPSRIQPPGRFVCGRRSPGRRVWTPVGRGDPPHGAATRIATLTGPRSFSLLRRGNAQCITQPTIVINKEATAAACASDIGENAMNIIRLSATAVLGFAALSGNASAQQPGTPTNLPPLQSQSLPPPSGTQTVQPFVPPPLQPLPSSAFTTCTVSCDTQAMNCQSACVPGGPGAANPSCNLTCSSQQLVCKQSCGSGQ
jgi:hypothetical protein